MKQIFKIVLVFFFNYLFILNGYAVIKQHDYHDELKTVTLLLDWKPNTN